MSTPLSQYYKSNGLVFVSGQVGIGSDGTIPEDFTNQAKNSLENLKKVLDEAGVKLENTVKTTLYLTDLAFFDELNQIYSDFFGSHKPARTTLGVKELPRFEGDPIIYIEVDAIAAQ